MKVIKVQAWECNLLNQAVTSFGNGEQLHIKIKLSGFIFSIPQLLQWSIFLYTCGNSHRPSFALFCCAFRVYADGHQQHCQASITVENTKISSGTRCRTCLHIQYLDSCVFLIQQQHLGRSGQKYIALSPPNSTVMPVENGEEGDEPVMI